MFILYVIIQCDLFYIESYGNGLYHNAIMQRDITLDYIIPNLFHV